jgi:L-alanine-DL-glutamate epimerase-like enolase superfamily enzyme
MLEMRIAAIETRRYRYPLDPPFTAAWDPEPRTHQDATVVIVRSDDGVEGYASGDALPDRELLESLLVGRDPTRAAEVHGAIETVDFHHGRNWILEVAVWDLVARAHGEPLWRHLGGRESRILAYASTGELVPAEERVSRCLALREAGVRAVKLRLHSGDWRPGLHLIEAVRDAVGSSLEIMVDANQGWRMPGDLTRRWELETALELARELEKLDVYWLEEPLPADDVEGYDALRRRTSMRIAAGEMVRTEAAARELVLRGGIDVVQPDVVLSGGIAGASRIAALANDEGRMWSPHTWTNGYGLLANLHAALAFSTCPYLEVPFDPPGWSAARRDWLLSTTLEIGDDGTISPPEQPGLGVIPDFDALDRYRVG